MKKEVVIAIFVGLSLGLIITFGIRTAQNSLKNRTLAHPSPKSQASQDVAAADHTLLITAPAPDEIVTDSELNIVGSTTANSMVSIVGSDGIETSTIADDTGAFNAPVTLIAGVNVITITSFDPAGDQSDTTFNVVLSTADLTATSSSKMKTAK